MPTGSRGIGAGGGGFARGSRRSQALLMRATTAQRKKVQRLQRPPKRPHSSISNTTTRDKVIRVSKPQSQRLSHSRYIQRARELKLTSTSRSASQGIPTPHTNTATRAQLRKPHRHNKRPTKSTPSIYSLDDSDDDEIAALDVDSEETTPVVKMKFTPPGSSPSPSPSTQRQRWHTNGSSNLLSWKKTHNSGTSLDSVLSTSSSMLGPASTSKRNKANVFSGSSLSTFTSASTSPANSPEKGRTISSSPNSSGTPKRVFSSPSRSNVSPGFGTPTSGKVSRGSPWRRNTRLFKPHSGGYSQVSKNPYRKDSSFSRGHTPPKKTVWSPYEKPKQSRLTHRPSSSGFSSSASASKSAVSKFFGGSLLGGPAATVVNDDVHFKNLGNTCYINAVLQAFLHTPAIQHQFRQRHWLRVMLSSLQGHIQSELKQRDSARPTDVSIDDQNHGDGTGSGSRVTSVPWIFKYLASLLVRVRRPKQTPLDLSPLLQYLAPKSLLVRQKGRQQDAQEFFSELSQLVDEEFLENGTVPRDRDDLCPFGQLFTSVVRTQLTCTSCGYKREKREAYRYFSLPLHAAGDAVESITSDANTDGPDVESNSNRSRSPLRLSKLFEEAFSPEVVEFRCELCQASTSEVTKKLTSTPPLLVLHLKRFQVSPLTGQSTKCCAEVVFPAVLNVPTSCVTPGVEFVSTTDPTCSVESPGTEMQKSKFDNLCSLGKKVPITHVGETATDLDDTLMRVTVALSECASPQPASPSRDATTSCSSSTDTNGGKLRYQLRAVIHHTGTSLQVGHYVTDILNPGEATWTRFNDSISKTRSIAEHKARYTDVGQTTYMYIYERCGGESNSAHPASPSDE